MHSTPALYPKYVPPGLGPGTVVIDQWTPPTFGGYVQSYYGTAARGTSLPGLVIAGREAQTMLATSGTPPQQATLAGFPVRIWRVVSERQAEGTGSAPVTGVAAVIAGRQVTLIGMSLTDAELGTVLGGLSPRPSGLGWDTASLPASLVGVAEGARSQDPAYIPYRLQLSSHITITVTHDVTTPRGACVCNTESWAVQLSSVNGKRAALIDMLATEPEQASPVREVEWQYSPDADVRLTYSGISTQEALKLASSLDTAPRSIWDSLRCMKTVAGMGAVTCRPQSEIPTL